MRYRCVCQYDGRCYSGWQRQPRDKTVQGEIEKALKAIFGVPITIHSASRTDSGVHALMQVFHFDTEIFIPQERLLSVINRRLPLDVAISHVERVPDDFHSRYDCIGKTYVYKTELSPQRNVFSSSYAYHYGKPINLELIRLAAHVLIGTHDFKGFMASGSDKENTVRTLYTIDFIQKETVLEMRISGDGFLYNMVRIIMGALLNVSEGRLTVAELEIALVNGDRQKLRRTAPSSGLYLVETRY
jgi:tRNA pseudouridine38-40 synthase